VTRTEILLELRFSLRRAVTWSLLEALEASTPTWRAILWSGSTPISLKADGMNILRRIVFLLTVVLSQTTLTSSAAPPHGGVYVYTDPATNRKITYDTDEMTFTDGHLIASMHSCPREYRCLRGGPIDFVLPPNWKRITEWTLRNDHFRKAGSRKFVFFDRTETVSVIEGSLTDAKVNYLFSDTRGLIAVEVIGPSGHGTLLSDSPCGFAATTCEP